MKEQLIQYVELLFAGGTDCEDVKQEILQNTLDRYDDLIAEGKVPEAAYRLAISGIGDINEILGGKGQTVPMSHAPVTSDSLQQDSASKRLMRAIGVGLYILSPLPLFVLSEFGMDTIGLCGTLVIVAAATVLMILCARKSEKNDNEEQEKNTKSPLQQSVSSLIWAFGLGIYCILSFSTNAWHITWVIFPILGAVDNFACVLVAKSDIVSYEVSIPPERNLHKSIRAIINAAGLTIYFLLSFTTGAWYCTWLIFPITSAVRGLATAILDYREAVKNET